ncbi:hypothetical protein AK830_g9006 [Neonectria ditissima]|uniref:BZIP domain-containing protein n=1 Tax=Neonectria ditissima TaxID=78410 RepID=A0A0P7B6L0_9HYPO|nr:hypothetical protein AK830_g9006 [Neonectria ditissima]
MDETTSSSNELALRPAFVTDRDDWSGLGSARERRKIQNRINQRARRLRQRQQSEVAPWGGSDNEPSPVRPNPASITTLINTVLRQEIELKTLVDAINILRLQSQDNRVIIRAFEIIAYQGTMARSTRPMPTMLPSLVQYNMSRALISNAEVLGLTPNLMHDEAISLFVLAGPWPAGVNMNTDTFPVGLRPTTLQYSTEHHPWIDLLPIPRLRDNLLQRDIESYDEAGLCCAFTGRGHREGAGVIVWGDSWDCNGWEVTEEFVRSWGWVIAGCWDLFRSTNRWRAQRGERPLFKAYQ